MELIASARLVRDAAYFDLLYSEWLVSRSMYRRIAFPISLAILGAGVCVVWLLGPRSAVGWALVAIGVLDSAEVMTHRRRTVAAGRQAIDNERIDLRFTSDCVGVTSGAGSDLLPYSAFEKVVESTRGFFLVMSTGRSIFVPKAAVTPADAVDRLRAKLSGDIG